MTVGVVIPYFNGEAWIDSTLRSLHRQTERISEIVLVDDGSTRTASEVINDRRVKIHANEANAGVGHARNVGLRMLKSEFVAFVDQDDLWHESHFSLLSQFLRDNPSVSAVSSRRLQFSSENDLQFSPNEEGYRALDPWRLFPFGDIFGGPSTVLIRRSAIEQTGKWDEVAVASSDYSMWHELSVVGEIVQLAAATAAHRIHVGATSYRLRREYPVDYFQDRIDAAERCGKLRVEKFPTEMEDIENRLRFAQTLLVIVRNLAGVGKESDGRVACQKLVRIPIQERDIFLRAAIKAALWHLDSDEPTRANQVRLLVTLFSYWPTVSLIDAADTVWPPFSTVLRECFHFTQFHRRMQFLAWVLTRRLIAPFR